MADKIENIIAKNIKKIRLENGFEKQEAFASHLNKLLKKYGINDGKYDSKSISNWENGASIPKNKVLIVLAKEYGLSLDELLANEINEVVLKNNVIKKDDEENDLLNDLVKSEQVCVKQFGELKSSWNCEMYKYGILSYLADNLTYYKGNLSKCFFDEKGNSCEMCSFILTSIITIDNGEINYHIIGNGKNDIVDVQKLSFGCGYRVKLGNGKTYNLYNSKIQENFDTEYLIMDKNNLPSDFYHYSIYYDDEDIFYLDEYVFAKGRDLCYCAINEKPIWTFDDEYRAYYEDNNVYACFAYVDLFINEKQLLKVLTDDYKHRKIDDLKEMSDSAKNNEFIRRQEDYNKKYGSMLKWDF